MGSWGFIGLLLFVLLNGCLPASDPQTTSKVCHFTYPSDGQKFIQMLENFYSFGEGQAFDKSSNKFLVIKQYMTLWNTHYDADISGSKTDYLCPQHFIGSRFSKCQGKTIFASKCGVFTD